MTDLIHYTIHLADNALILGHRNSEWTGHGPILEQDIALSNIALDLVGQSRYFYQYAARLINNSNHDNTATEDTLAYLRDTRDFKNCLITELPNGDWGKTILRQCIFSAYQFYLYSELKNSKDSELSAIAAKALKEVTYHLKWSGEWVIRLGDGTEESHERMQIALDELWPFAGELFVPALFEHNLLKQGIAPDPRTIREEAMKKIADILSQATLDADRTKQNEITHNGGKDGLHTEHLGYLLAEMQFLQRAYPGNEW